MVLMTKNWKNIFKKILIHLSSVADPGCLSRIPDPDFYPSRIPDPATKFTKIKIILLLKCGKNLSRIQGSKRHRIPDPQHYTYP
jgi:hypothetical protein